MEYTLYIQIPLPKEMEEELAPIKAYACDVLGSTYQSLPHITLHILRLQKSQFLPLVRAFKKSLKNIAPKISVSSLSQEKNPLDANTFISLRIKKLLGLKRLHETTVRIANRYRHGLIREKDKLRMEAGLYSPLEKEQIKKYGYVRVLSLFDPHITIANVPQKHVQDVQKQLKKTLKKIIGKTFIPDRMIFQLWAEKSGRKSKQVIEVSLAFLG